METWIPLGFDPTIKSARGTAAQGGVISHADAFIERGLAHAVPRARWLVQKSLLGGKVLFAGDPYTFVPMVEVLHELGCKVRALVWVGSERHLGSVPHALASRWVPALFGPTPDELRRLMQMLLKGKEVDLCNQTDSHGWTDKGNYGVVPFGFARWT